MEVEITRAEFATAVRRDRDFIAQDAIRIVPDLERARVFRALRGAFVAARDQDDALIVGRDADLMREDAEVHRLGLFDQRAGRAVVVDAIHLEQARVVVVN